MAEPETCKDIQLLKRTKIDVFVDEVLPDILVVTYEFGLQIFKGVLLDSTKKNLPYGIQNLNPAFKIKPKPPEDDPLYAANQRYAYTDPNAPKKKNVQISSKYKNSKMTVRLRPRQVLCSKCKGICNENSENVSRKRKQSDAGATQAKRGPDAPVTRSVSHTDLTRKKLGGTATLVPRLTRLTAEEEMALNCGTVKIDSKTLKLANKENDEDSSDEKRTLRKNKRSVGSMEDLWDETVFEEKANEEQLNLSTKTIKISFGPQGEGTVLKIPAQIENLKEEEDNKAARKALKKAKKEAKKKIFVGGSPCYGGGSSPRYTVGSASPRQGLGNNSPRYMCTSYELSLPRRRKHKMKHKKKHKEEKDRKHKESEVSSTQQEEALTQKLSINLKRLNNTYTTADKAEDNTSSSDEHSEQVPDFPPPTMLRINSQTLTSVNTADGGRMLVGDVVWGKIHGFPWWPGKVLTITNCGGPPQAHVAWYGSSTSSLMQCDQLCPYLENFKTRYNKKKRGPYKEAIKQASLEAKENAQMRMRQPLGNSPSQSHNNIIQPALASPREIDVVS